MGCIKRIWKLEDTSKIQEELTERPAGKISLPAFSFLKKPLTDGNKYVTFWERAWPTGRLS